MMDEEQQKFLIKTRASVEVERAKQELWFSEAIKHSKTQNDFDETLVGYVFGILIAHAQALLDVGFELNRPASEIREQIKQAISDVTDEAYELKHQYGQSADRNYFRPGFRQKVYRAVMASQEWREIQENLKTLAESQAETSVVNAQAVTPQATQPAKEITAPTPATQPPAQGGDIGEQLEWARLRDGKISHEEQAHRIGISRSTYFEVKGGRGKEWALRLTKDYLERIRTKSTDPD